MSGPKYYTIDVPDEDVNEVYRRLSKFRMGVSVKVVNGRLEYKVSNDAWMRGVDKASLTKEVRKVEQEIADDRRLREMFEKGKAEETYSMKDAKKAIENEYRTVSEELRKTTETLEKLMKNSVSEISTPFGRIQVSGSNEDIKKAISDTEAQSEKLKQIKDAQIKACDDYADSIEKVKTLKEYDKIRKRRPKTVLDCDYPRSDVSELAREVDERNKRARRIEGRLNDLDRQLSDYGLDGYRDRIKEKLKGIDILAGDAPAKIDDLLSEIKKENEARINALRRSADDARTRDEIDRINSEMVSLGKLLKPVMESFSEGSELKVDNTEENRKRFEKCSDLIREIREMGREYGLADDRLKRAENTLNSCRTGLKSVDTANKLDRLSSELKKLREETEVSVKKREEFEKAKKAYDEAYARYASSFEDKEEVNKELKGYDRMVDMVYSDRNAAEAIEELLEKAKMLDGLVEEVKKNDQYRMMMGVFSFSSEYISSGTDKEGNVHTYFAKKGEEYKGVIFDAVKGDTIAVVPRRVRLSNGRYIITAKQLDEVHKGCHWSEEMEEECKELGIDLRRTEADKEYQQQVCSDAEAVRLSEEESMKYLETIDVSESEAAALGYTIKKGSGKTTSTKKEDHKEKEKVRYADR